MTVLFVTGITVIAAVALYVVCEGFLDLLPGRRSRERAKGFISAVLIGVALLAPRAFTSAIDWYAHRKIIELQHQLEGLLPTTTTTQP